MNLLTDQWIPVRPIQGGGVEKITLQRLLCEDGKWELSLPRDDMELAAMQLVICITQALITPKTATELKTRIVKPLSAPKYDAVTESFTDWFRLDHPEYPFMQRKGARVATAMEKLMTGLTGATNCCFVNEPGLAAVLCGGCTAIALFNLATCSPSFGGGFKPGLRGPTTPITTLVQGRHLRETVWLNVLAEDELDRIMPWHRQTLNQKPTWVEPIQAGEKIEAQQIALRRGLFWQPAHVEVSPSEGGGICRCCGFKSEHVYSAFTKDKFSFTVVGTWPHPHSPLTMRKKSGVIEERFASFGTSSAPSWTQLARLVVQQEIDENSTEGHQPAAVIQQVRKVFGQLSQKLHLLVGGYLNRAGQASVVGRRHEVFTLNHGWNTHPSVINYLVSLGLGYRDALCKALYVFVKGVKGVKGAGVELHNLAEPHYYRRSEPTMENTLARIDFAKPEQELAMMRKSLRRVVEDLFKESVRPYLQDPELIHTLAVARRTLNKHLKNLEPQKDKGGTDGTTKTS